MSPTTYRHHILLIEDERDLAELLVEVLAAVQCEVRLAASVAEAEALLVDYTPCAIVTDLTLPDALHAEVIRRIRVAAGAVPILLMSAIAPDELARLAAEEGAQGVIAKPFDLELFERTIELQCAGVTTSAPV